MRSATTHDPLSGPGVVRVPAPGTVLGIGGRQSGLVDQFDRPYRAPRDPLSGESPQIRAEQLYRDIPTLALSPEWTIAEVRSALTAHVQGQFALSAILCDSITGDDRVQAALGSRVSALFGLPMVHVAAPGDTDERVLTAWKHAWTLLAPASVLSEIMRWTHLLGFAVAEVLWNTEQTPWQPYLKFWHPQNIRFDWMSRTLRAITLEGEVEITPGDGRWFVHAPHGIYRGWMQGAVRPLALPWLLRNFAMRDWARYSEVHGLPMLLASIPAMASAEDKAQFIASLQARGGEAIAELPEQIDGAKFDLRLLEASSQSWQGFMQLISKCDMGITLTLQWQNLAGGAEVKEGSLAIGRIHSDVKQSALIFDNAMLAFDVQQQLGRPFAEWNFGNADLAPYTARDVETPEDRAARMALLESFSRAVGGLVHAGQPVDVPALARAHGVPLAFLVGQRSGDAPIFGYHLTAGVITRDELRERLGLPPIGGIAGGEFLGQAQPGETDTSGQSPTPAQEHA